MVSEKNTILQEQKTIAIDTAMLQSYHDASAFELMKSIKPRKNEQGELDILFLNSNSEVHFIRTNKFVDSGWELITSKINGQSICLSPIKYGKEQRMFIANASEGNTEILEIVYYESILYSRSICSVNRDGGENTILTSGLAEMDGKEGIILVLSGGQGKWSAIINVKDGDWYYTYPYVDKDKVVDMEGFLSPLYPNKSSGVWPEISLIADVFYKGKYSSFYGPSKIYYMRPNGEINTIDGHSAISYDYVVAQSSGTLPLSRYGYGYSLVVDKDNVLNLFSLSIIGIESNNLEESINLEYGVMQTIFDGTNWLPSQGISTTLGAHKVYDIPPYASLIATLNLKGEIELIILSTTDNILLHCSQFKDNSGNINWSSWLPISRNCKVAGVGKFENGFTQVFVDGLGDDSFKVLYQTETSVTNEDDEQNWTEEPIIWENLNNPDVRLNEGQAYRTTVTIFGADGATANKVKCSIDVSDFLPCHVNCKYYELQPSKPIVFETNALGQINIEYVLEESIYSPSFSITLPDELSSFICKPDRDTFTFFNDITPNDLDWYTPEGTGIIPKDKNIPETRENVSKAIKNVADMAKSYFKEYKGDTSVFAKNVNLVGIDVVEKSKVVLSSKIPYKEQKEKAGKYSVINGKAFFEEITLEDYTLIKSNYRDARIELKDKFGGFFDFFGDLFQAVKDVATSVLDIVWDGINAAITFVVNGVNYFVETTVETVRDVFEIVATILDMLGTIIGTVVVWVLNLLGFLFDWKKIIEVKNQIKEQVNSGFTTFSNWMIANSPSIEQKINGLLDSLPAKLIEDKNKIEGMEIGQKRPDSYNGNARMNGFTVDGVCFWNQGTWLMDQVMDKVFRAIMPNFNDSDAINELWNTITELASALETTANAQLIALKEKLLSLFQTFIDKPFDILTNTMDTIISLVIDFVNTLFELIRALIGFSSELFKKATAVLNSLFSWFDQELNIPFIRTFYKEVIGSPLTLMDVCCLILAVPVSIADSLFYKTEEAISGLSKKNIGLLSGLAITVSEIFALSSNFVAENVGGILSIFADIFGVIAGALWIDWAGQGASNDPLLVLGVIIIGFGIVDCIFRLRNIIKGPQGNLKIVFYFIEALAGFICVVAGIVGISLNPDKLNVLLGTSSILIGSRFLISSVMDFSGNGELKKKKEYVAYVLFDSGVLLLLSGLAGKEDQYELISV